MTFPCLGSAFRSRGGGPPQTRFVAPPAAPRSSDTRRCGPFSACSTPLPARSARRTGRCSTRPLHLRTSRGRPIESGWGPRQSERRCSPPRCAPFIAPALLAKALTSLDVLSDGRLTAGLGMGWLRQEYAAAGVPYERRGERMDEYLRCLEALWTQDPVEFAGE